jgi:hypothetical protein
VLKPFEIDDLLRAIDQAFLIHELPEYPQVESRLRRGCRT